MEYTVRFKTIWLATTKSFYHKSRTKNLGAKIYEFRAWRMPMNLAWRMMREGYAMNEETAAAWAIEHAPTDGKLRGVSRDAVYTFPTGTTMEDVLKFTKARLIREEVGNLSPHSYNELCMRKGNSGCREFKSFRDWAANATSENIQVPTMTSVH